MKKICSKCGKETSLLVKGKMCKQCRADLDKEPVRTRVYEIPKDITLLTKQELLAILCHNFKVHCSTGFRNDKEKENYELTCKLYKEHFGKDFPKVHK